MDMKKTAVQMAVAKISSTKRGRKMIKNTILASVLSGSALAVYMMASEGKKLSDKNN